MRRKRPQDSIRFAAEGILHCFRTQRHMRFHFLMLVLVLLSGLLLALDTKDMLVLLFSISLVIVTEMFNTAVEAIVDMIAQGYHPQAKLAKDVAAGAVLAASANATISGVLIFFGGLRISELRDLTPEYTPEITVIIVVGLLVLTMTVVISKLRTGRDNPELVHGGIVSGHSAIGFFLAMTIVFTSGSVVVMVIALLMAVIIAQSRVEAGVHSVQEVVMGAVIAIFLTSAVYRLMPYFRSRVMTRPAAARPLRHAERDPRIANQTKTSLQS